jgi:hypothetical protein
MSKNSFEIKWCLITKPVFIIFGPNCVATLGNWFEKMVYLIT